MPSNLPIEFQDKINSPELLAFLQQFGEEAYVDAALINKFRDAINEINLSINPDRVITLGGEIKTGNIYTYENYVWMLNGISYNNTGVPIARTIANAGIGYKRKDISVFTTNNTIEIIQGTETNGATVTTPDVPEGTLFFKTYDIDGSTIAVDPVDPVVGDRFVKKSSYAPFLFLGSGTDAIIPLDPNGYSEIRLQNPLLESIAGYDLSLIDGNSSAEIPYNGKPYVIRNLTGNDIIIKNELPTAVNGFFLSGGADLIFPANCAIYVSYDVAGFNELFKGWSSGGTPDNIFGYFNGTSFFTDALYANLITPDATKLYISLNGNMSYRYDGSGYVVVGGGSNTLLELTDTPATYTGQALKVARVNAAENAIEFVTAAGGGDENQLNRLWYNYFANVISPNLILANTTNPLVNNGTFVAVSRSGNNFYNSLAMNNYLSTAATGANCGVKNNNTSDGSYLEGFDSTVVFANNDTNVNCETTVGFYGLLSNIPNIAKSAYTTDFVGVGNDVGDVNLSFYSRTYYPSLNATKIDCGVGFPAHTLTDVYKLRMECNRTLVNADRTIKMTLTNTITGDVFTHTFTGLLAPSYSKNITICVNRSNRNTGVATNIRFSKFHITRFIF